MGIIVVAILHMRKPRAKEVMGLAQGHQGWSHHSNLCESDSKDHGVYCLYQCAKELQILEQIEAYDKIS